MNQSKGFYLAAAPVALLLLLGVGARLLSPTASDAAGMPQKGASANASPTPAKPADAATQRLLEKTVGGQIAALRKKDYVGALKFAAASYRSSMTPENFGQMVQAGYAPMTMSVHVTFAPAQLRDRLAAVPTTVVDKAGAKTQYLYILTKDGKEWVIDGCQSLTPLIPHPAATPIDEREI